jgi:hypothetical protein
MDAPHYAFTPLELQRLIAYRAAVRAGFYTEWPPSQACGPVVLPRATACLDPQSAERR